MDETVVSTLHSGKYSIATTGKLRYWLTPLALIAVLLVTAFNNFLLFHTLAELFTVVVALIMFVVAWQTYPFTRNAFLMFLGIGYCWVGMLDLVHALAYKDMGIFPAHDGGMLSTQLWLSARAIETLVLLTSVYFLNHPLKREFVFLLFGMASLALLTFSFSGYFPATYVEGQGLTTFKIASEYVMIVLMLVALALIIKQRAFLETRILKLIALAIISTVLAEVLFTAYVTVNDSINMIGHFFKFISFWIVFVAIVKTNLTEPFQLMAKGSSTYDAIPASIVVVDHDGIIRQANQEAVNTASIDGPGLIGLHVHHAFHDETIDSSNCPLCDVIRDGKTATSMDMEIGSRGVWREFTVTPIHVKGVVSGMVHVSSDITSRKRAEQSLNEANELLQISQQRLSMHVEKTPLGVIEFDTAFNVIHWNLAAERIFGFKANEMLGHPIETIIPETEIESLKNVVWKNVLEKHEGSYSKNHNLTKDKRVITCEWYNTPIEDDSGNIVCVACLINDVTERERAEERLLYQANYDTLTGLPNRILAFDRLGQAIKSAHRHKQAMAVLFVDIDFFKNVNDTLGHFVGDQLLINIAGCLRNSVREDDTVARLGGDEFLIILTELHRVEEAEFIAEKILTELARPIVMDEREFHVTASIGISGYPNDGSDPHLLLSNADTAMYQAKSSGRNSFSFFTKEMNEAALKRLELEGELRYAIAREELSLHYQPQLDLRSGRIIGAEALLRWNNGARGMVSPLDFIPLAEDTGLIGEIGKWVLRTACEQAVRWSKEGLPDLRVSVNISARQLKEKRCLDMVRHVLAETGLSPSRLELELTESILVENTTYTLALLTELKALGVRLTLDDFGTGYSSLSYLKRFPFDAIKIDRSFVMDIPTDQNDIELCRAIIAIADSLKMEVVGEGAEKEEQVAFLRDSGATLV